MKVHALPLRLFAPFQECRDSVEKRRPLAKAHVYGIKERDFKISGAKVPQ